MRVVDIVRRRWDQGARGKLPHKLAYITRRFTALERNSDTFTRLIVRHTDTRYGICKTPDIRLEKVLAFFFHVLANVQKALVLGIPFLCRFLQRTHKALIVAVVVVYVRLDTLEFRHDFVEVTSLNHIALRRVCVDLRTVGFVFFACSIHVLCL